MNFRFRGYWIAMDCLTEEGGGEISSPAVPKMESKRVRACPRQTYQVNYPQAVEFTEPSACLQILSLEEAGSLIPKYKTVLLAGFGLYPSSTTEHEGSTPSERASIFG